MIADGNRSDDGGAAVAATIGNERAAARWVSDRPSIVLPAPGGARGAYDGECAERRARSARGAHSVGLFASGTRGGREF